MYMGNRVMLVERDRLMLEKLTQVVQGTNGFELVARYQSISDALGQGTIFNPNLILLDIEAQNSVALIADFLKVYPKAAILCMGENYKASAL